MRERERERERETPSLLLPESFEIMEAYLNHSNNINNLNLDKFRPPRIEISFKGGGGQF